MTGDYEPDALPASALTVICAAGRQLVTADDAGRVREHQWGHKWATGGVSWWWCDGSGQPPLFPVKIADNVDAEGDNRG